MFTLSPSPKIAAAILLIALFALPIFAQETSVQASFATATKEPIQISLLTGQSCLILFDKPFGRLSISNQEPAETVPVTANQLVINGKALGRSRLIVWSNQDSQFLFFDIDVRANLEQIDAQVRALFPKEDVRLSQANGAVVISGKVKPEIAKQVESVVQAGGFKTVNLFELPVQNIAQIQLQVKVAEVSRNKLMELAASPVVQMRPGEGAYTNTGLGPWAVNKVEEGSLFGAVSSTLNVFLMSNNAFMFIRALQNQGALRGLAEPNLIAMNGQQASFLAGGEIPIPIVQGGTGLATVTILFKEYGVRLNFKPTIIDEQHIRLELEPEVSTLDYSNAIRLGGFLIPALRVRRAKTGVELQDGQSFGIAGLMDNNELKSLSKIPLIGDIPILGNLFKSKSFQRNETELVFIVTAKIVQPLNPDSVPQMRGIDGLKGDSPLGVELPGHASGSANLKKADQPESKTVPVTGQPESKTVPAEETPTETIAPIKVLPPMPILPREPAGIKALVWRIWLPGSPVLTARRSQLK
ncbi:MAG: type II and III secretion system protein family protein [Acidobacteriota bacterium]